MTEQKFRHPELVEGPDSFRKNGKYDRIQKGIFLHRS